jgi:ABC-type branched-subunit amino acid transport system ATPase component
VSELAIETLDLAKRFGGVHAVDHISLSIPVNEIRGVIGPNGAGKTTLFNVISGVNRPTAGRVWLGDVLLTGRGADRIARDGVTRTFQTPVMFAGLTVRETLMVALAARPGARRVEDSLLSCGLRFGERARERSLVEAVDALLAGLPIAALADLPCEGLSFGQERMVEIVRALAIEPRVLLLDEPLSGLNADEIPPVLELVASARARGIAVLFVEHDLRSLLRAVDRLVVLDHGKKIAQGDPESVCADPAVLEAYIGDELVA